MAAMWVSWARSRTWARGHRRGQAQLLDTRRDRYAVAVAKWLHRSPGEQARWGNHVRFISPLHRQVEYLRLAGFQGIDVYWKQLDYVIYGGCRPG